MNVTIPNKLHQTPEGRNIFLPINLVAIWCLNLKRTVLLISLNKKVERKS